MPRLWEKKEGITDDAEGVHIFILCKLSLSLGTVSVHPVVAHLNSQVFGCVSESAGEKSYGIMYHSSGLRQERVRWILLY